jgi:putative endonuclease
MVTSRGSDPGRPLPFHLRAGRAAEDEACRFLTAQGLRILERNFRVRGGEIDIIALDGGALVFCEVRLRSRGDFGGALESIDRRKQARLAHAASCYLQRFPLPPPCRLDALCASRRDPWEWLWIRGL